MSTAVVAYGARGDTIPAFDGVPTVAVEAAL